MKLCEMSFVYREDAVRFQMRITELRHEMKQATTKKETQQLMRRIADLLVLVRQSRELADLTQHYYERGYHRNEKYTL